MDFFRLALAVFVALTLAGLASGTAAAETDEERYAYEITLLHIEANIHLDEASDAFADCLAAFSACIEDRSPFIQRLNASRAGLMSVRDGVLAIEVPARYRSVNDLTIAGLTSSIQGTTLHMEGLEEGSLAKLDAGSAYMAQGRDELAGAVQQLRANPPRSLFEQILPILLIAIAGSLALSIGLILRWYRREVRKVARPPHRKDSS